MRRFRHHRQFLKCCGLDHDSSQSGQSRGKEGLSKRGNKRLRMILVGWLARDPSPRERVPRKVSPISQLEFPRCRSETQGADRDCRKDGARRLWRRQERICARANISHFLNNDFPTDRSLSHGPLNPATVRCRRLSARLSENRGLIARRFGESGHTSLSARSPRI